jgi:very-short-patch-repair endonuclease
MVRYADLIAAVGRAEFERALAQKEIKRHTRGLYTAGPAITEQLKASELRGTVSHLTAAWHWNLGITTRPVRWDVTVPAHSKRRNVPDDVTLWYRTLPDDDRQGRYTSPLRTVIDCLRDTPATHGLAVLEHAVALGMVGIDEVAAQVKALRGPGSAAARRVLSWYDARASPPLESALRAILLTAGITCFEPQLVIRDGDRQLARVDLGDPCTGVLLEADSFRWHGAQVQLTNDAERYDELVARGYRVLRFAFDHVASRGGWIVEVVRRTLALARGTA